MIGSTVNYVSYELLSIFRVSRKEVHPVRTLVLPQRPGSRSPVMLVLSAGISSAGILCRSIDSNSVLTAIANVLYQHPYSMCGMGTRASTWGTKDQIHVRIPTLVGPSTPNLGFLCGAF